MPPSGRGGNCSCTDTELTLLRFETPGDQPPAEAIPEYVGANLPQ